jgi:hypothetical protein
VIDSIYNLNGDFYFPKSRVFLYPLLGIRSDSSVRPIDTYVSWDSIVKEDRKLICTFYLRNDLDYKKFEQSSLFGNQLFHDFKEAEGGIGIYIFDFGKYSADWDRFLKGKYSHFSLEAKDKIKRAYSGNNSNAVYVESYIYPQKYYPIYAKILGVPIHQLEGGELCDLPNFEKEELKMLVKDVSVKDNSLGLPKQ